MCPSARRLSQFELGGGGGGGTVGAAKKKKAKE